MGGIRIDAIYIAPVKSLGLNRVERARIEKRGIEGDRRFFMVDAAGQLFTVRDHFAFVQARAEYDADAEHLALRFPGDTVVEGDATATGEQLTVNFHGARDVEGSVVEGPFGGALSQFAGQPVRLVRVQKGTGFDALPLSIVSRESLAAFADIAGRDADDGRRFRQNLYITGVDGPHAEDAWVGRDVRIGASAIVRGVMPDQRCVVTTRDPDTGDHELNTLKLITSYRTEAREPAFGVYFGVVEPGDIAVGDEITPL
jgi:uncharacterized protein YcbX